MISNTLTDSAGRTMTWDSQNRMVSCAYNGQTTTSTYGADGLRRSSTVNGVTTYYVYDGQTLIREMHKNVQTGALYNTATYLTGPRGPEYRRDDTLQELDSQGKTVSKCRWYVFDGLGSVVGEVDPSGNLTSSPKYDVYGLVRANPGTASSAMGFVGGLGHLSEASTGLIYMRARYYDPALGRFASEDKKGDGNNWFVYCNNNPVNNVDANGNETGELLEEIGAFMLATLTCKMFQVSLAAMFLATLTCILAPLAFVACLPVPIAGLCLGASAAILTVQRMFAMMQAVSASSGFGGGIGMIEAKGSVVGPVYEVCTMIGGYGAGLYLIMEADDAYQELT